MKHICHISQEKKNIAFINLFETSFGSDIFVSFTNFECQDIDYSGSHWVENFEIYIVDGLLLTKFQSPSLKIWRGVDDWNTLTKMQFLINSSFRIYQKVLEWKGLVLRIFSKERNQNRCWTLRKKCPYLELFWSVFVLNTGRYFVYLRIKPEWGKIRARITPNRNTFYAVFNIHFGSAHSGIFAKLSLFIN